MVLIIFESEKSEEKNLIMIINDGPGMGRLGGRHCGTGGRRIRQRPGQRYSGHARNQGRFAGRVATSSTAHAASDLRRAQSPSERRVLHRRYGLHHHPGQLLITRAKFGQNVR